MTDPQPDPQSAPKPPGDPVGDPVDDLAKNQDLDAVIQDWETNIPESDEKKDALAALRLMKKVREIMSRIHNKRTRRMMWLNGYMAGVAIDKSDKAKAKAP